MLIKACLWATLQKKLSVFLAQKFCFQRCCWARCKIKIEKPKAGRNFIVRKLKVSQRRNGRRCCVCGGTFKTSRLLYKRRFWNSPQSPCIYNYYCSVFEHKFFGKLLEKEVLSIDKVMKSGEKPVLAILGAQKFPQRSQL